MSSGKIVQIIGAVVDVEFPRDSIPKVYDALTVDEAGLTLEVQQQLGDGVVRAIAMGVTDGLKRDLGVSNTGETIQVPVGQKTLGRIMDVLGNPIDEKGDIGQEESWGIHRKAPSFDELAASNELLETGIKVIDLVCPSLRPMLVGNLPQMAYDPIALILQYRPKCNGKCYQRRITRHDLHHGSIPPWLNPLTQHANGYLVARSFDRKPAILYR